MKKLKKLEACYDVELFRKLRYTPGIDPLIANTLLSLSARVTALEREPASMKRKRK